MCMEIVEIAKLSTEIKNELKKAKLNNDDALKVLEAVEYAFLEEKIKDKKLTFKEALNLIKASRARFDKIMAITHDGLKYIRLNGVI